jgi:hypothetical protein
LVTLTRFLAGEASGRRLRSLLTAWVSATTLVATVSACTSAQRAVATAAPPPVVQTPAPMVNPEPPSAPIGPPGTIPSAMPDRAVITGLVLDAVVVNSTTLGIEPPQPILVFTIGVVPTPGVPGADLPSAGRGLDRYELLTRDTSLASHVGATVRVVTERRGSGAASRLWLTEVRSTTAKALPPAPATQSGWTRVIVELSVAATTGDSARAAAIAAARSALLGELADGSFRVVRTYDTLSFVALELSPAALDIVRRSRQTVGIQPDALASPQGR